MIGQTVCVCVCECAKIEQGKHTLAWELNAVPLSVCVPSVYLSVTENNSA